MEQKEEMITDTSSGAVAAEAGAPPADEWKPTRSFYLAFASLLILALTLAFDATILSVALPQISEELQATALEAFWGGTSFLVGSSTLLPTLAALSNIFGRKPILLLGTGFFAAGSLVGALAPNMAVVIVGRVLQGVGAGGIIALSEIVIADIVPLAHRGSWLSLINGTWAIGTVCGPLIGAGFAQNVTWRWIFWINLPLSGASAAALVLFLHQEPTSGDFFHKICRFDWIGSLLLTGGVATFLFAVSSGGVMNPWASYNTLVPLFVGLLGVGLFAGWEVRFAKEPMIHPGIFNNWTLRSVYIQIVMHGIVLWSLIYFLVLYYEGVKLYEPITAAVAMLPETILIAPSSAMAAFYIEKTHKYRPAGWLGWVLTTLGAGLLYLLQPGTSVPGWIFLNFPVSIGTGILFTSLVMAVQAACKPELTAQAIAFFALVRELGQGIGVATSGVVFQNLLEKKLLELPAFAGVAHEYSRDATILVGIINGMGPGDARNQLVESFNGALQTLWLVLLAFAGAGLIASLVVKAYSLEQVLVTEQGLVDKQKKRRGDEPERTREAPERTGDEPKRQRADQ